jgi:hypothetical protein
MLFPRNEPSADSARVTARLDTNNTGCVLVHA